MRLFLSSYRAGKYPDRLVELFGKGTKLGVITNAKDYKTPDDQKLQVDDVLSFFSNLDMHPAEIDLRKYFDDSRNIEKDLSKYNAFWLAGGNTFLLRRAIRQSGLEPLLADWVRKNQVVLGGESAGAIVCGPTLRGTEDESGDEDSPYFVAEGYDKEIIWEGLDIISYVPVPHYKAVDYGPIIDLFVEVMQKNKTPYKTMTDDQAIVINGSKEEFLE